RQRISRRAGLWRRRRGPLLQYAQDVDLRRVERDSAQHHRQSRSGAVRGNDMDFSFTEEQTLLRNSVSKYLADNYAFDAWRKFTRNEQGRDPKHWQQFAELGLFAVALPEEHGGLGGGPVDSMIIAEEFGRALVVEPYIPTVVIGGGVLKYGGSDAQKAEWMPKIASGESMMAFAFAEPQGRYNLADLKTTAK